ncbi:MAG: prolyl oligopeptidase family serine peptidase [Alphaproteobacteria bacterium]|nr:prolyl oligopeptidase family serine peptidase [Alphaproteobacteria bacterium]
MDDRRMVVSGQSYGGFMVLAAITEYPDDWCAAVDFTVSPTSTHYSPRPAPGGASCARWNMATRIRRMAAKCWPPCRPIAR